MAIDLDGTSFVLLKSEVFALWLGKADCSFLGPSQCHNMVSGTDFQFAFSLVCLQGLRAEHSAKNPLCVWKSDVSS